MPLDPKLPSDRLRYMVQQCGCVAVVVQQWHVDIGGCLGVDACVAEAVLWNESGAAMNRTVVTDVDMRWLAYVLFTSGSTGKPKGVMVQHESLAAMLHATQYEGAFSATDVFAYTVPFTFDPSVKDVWATLTIGGKLAIRRGALTDTDQLWALLHLDKVTIWDTVPSLLSVYMEAIRTHKALPRSAPAREAQRTTVAHGRLRNRPAHP